MEIKLFDIELPQEAYEEVDSVLSSGHWAMGEETKEFEDEFAKRLNAKRVVLYNNGTAALMAAFVLSKSRGMVFMPSMTFPGNYSMLRQINLLPILVDSTDWSFEMDLKNAELGFMDSRRMVAKTGILDEPVSAIFPTHLYGHPFDWTEINDFARKHKLAIIEDCSHGFGAELNGIPVGGNKNAISCFSFYPTKPLPMPSGGAVVVHEGKYFEIDAATNILEKVRSWGFDYRGGKPPYTYKYTGTSLNFRPVDTSAAVGLAMLDYAEHNRERREEIATIYMDCFEAEGICCINNKRGTSAWHLFNIMLDESQDRTKFMAYMKEKGIQTAIHYLPLHWTDVGRPFDFGNLTITDNLAGSIVTLPCHALLDDDDIALVIKHTLEWCKQ